MPDATVLVVSSSAHGNAWHIAEHVASTVASVGFEARTVPTHDADAADPGGAAGIVVVVPVHHGQFDGATVAWMARRRDLIDRVPSLVLSVSIAAAGAGDASRAETRELLAELVLRSNVTPALAASVAGAVDHDGIPLFARAGLRDEAARHGLAASTEHDTVFTDWDALEQLEHRFLALLEVPRGDAKPTPRRTAGAYRGPRPVSSASAVGLGTLRAPGHETLPDAPPAPLPQDASFVVPELSVGEALITCRPLSSPVLLREITAGVASIPGVASVSLESAGGDRAVLRVGLERPVALGAELLTHLAHLITACRYADGHLEVDVVADPGAPAPRRVPEPD